MSFGFKVIGPAGQTLIDSTTAQNFRVVETFSVTDVNDGRFPKTYTAYAGWTFQVMPHIKDDANTTFASTFYGYTLGHPFAIYKWFCLPIMGKVTYNGSNQPVVTLHNTYSDNDGASNNDANRKLMPTKLVVYGLKS